MKNFISNISLRLILFSLFLANGFLMAQTDWVVNSSEYQYSMTDTAVLSNGNDFSINENDQIGVFDQNGTCVGVSTPSVYYEPLDANLVFLVIYSNSVNNSYEVRAYFDEDGTEIEFLDIVFIANSTQGSIANPYVFHENETISIEGCTDPDSDNYNPEAINDDGSCFTTVLGCMNQDAPNYDPEANTSDNSCISWQDYSQELELFLTIYENMLDSANILISDLTSTNDSITNLLLTLENQETFIEVDSYIDMPQGWSMFGYTCPDYKNVIEAFSEISNNIEIVKDEWGLAYLPAWNFNAFDNLEYGEGYQIKMIQEVTNFQFCPKIIVE